jgi:hypothetical protein
MLADPEGGTRQSDSKERFVATLTVLDPRAEHSRYLAGNGKDLGLLRGKTVGLKTDEFWLSWDWVAEEWAAALKTDGADCVVWREPMPKEGDEADAVAKSFTEFLDTVDGVVAGLPTCGACTLVAVKTGMAALDRGKTTVFVATEHFERLARVLTEDAGFADIRMTILPYPLEGRPEAEIREIARNAYPSMLASLGAIR